MSIKALEILNTKPPQVIEVTVPGPKGKSSPNGGVFITNVTPQASGHVGSKVYDETGTMLISCASTTQHINVEVLAITGHTRYKPQVTVQGNPVSLVADGDKPLFEGNVDVVLNGTELVAEHEDGASHVVEVQMDTPPQIVAAEFISPYPGTQTELKENDTMEIRVQTDMDVQQIQVDNFGACKSTTVSASGDDNSAIVTIADRGDTAQEFPFRVRAQSITGAWSDWYITEDKVTLNNLHPSVSFSGVTYPAGQSALKDNEIAFVSNSAQDFDSIQYISTQLNVSDPNVYETVKNVARQTGNYNVASNNLVLTAHREANDSTSTASVLVKIAHVPPIVTIFTPSRLRSGGNAGTSAQDHTVTVSSSQQISGAPELSAPVGAWQGDWSGSGSTWSRDLRIHDDDPKGVHSFTGLTVVSLSGQVVNTINHGADYEVGGFVFRVLTVPAFPNREALIGTQVVDVSKLRCTNLSKGPSGSLNFAYQATTDEAVDKYTVIGGNTWYNCDGANASSNTTGTMQIEIEELA